MGSALILLLPLLAQEVGNAVCAGCHAEIARSFVASPMGRTSGPVDAVSPADFVDDATSVHYRVRSAEGGALLEFDRRTPELRGSRKLTWQLGSGRVGHSYLFNSDGFLYQSPVSFYASTGAWRASPGFQNQQSANFTRAVEPACLQCHASQIKLMEGTQNRYESIPFLQAGVSCERCHGPGGQHAANMKRGGQQAKNLAIVHPSKLDAERRDSICAQCHFTGAARVARTNPPKSFQAGNRLSDSVAVFVRSDAANSGLAVTSHFEKLSYSKCKQASGDKLWCASCHDPHGGKVSVRERCVSCHTMKTCSLESSLRQAKADQCQDCHMPKSPVVDVEHSVYTDHSIPKRPREAAQSGPARELTPFWKNVTPRDTALAYATVAITEPSLRREAFERLRAAAAQLPDDIAIAAQLAQFYDRMGQPQLAQPLFEKVIAQNPSNTAALVNLGTIYAQQGRLTEAMSLWQRALASNPALTQARVNLAVAQLRSGDRAAGLASLQEASRYDPDSPAVRELLRAQ